MKNNLHIEKVFCHSRPYFKNKPCEKCGLPLNPDEKIKIVEIRNTYMRGDDEVFAFHLGCLDNEEITKLENL